MASRNTNLHKAKNEKNDEFYTQLKDSGQMDVLFAVLVM